MNLDYNNLTCNYIFRIFHIDKSIKLHSVKVSKFNERKGANFSNPSVSDGKPIKF